MMMRRWAAAAATVLVTTGLVGPATPGWAAADAPSAAAAPPSVLALPEPPSPEEARMQLASLPVAPENDVPGYSRSKFPHWVIQYGTCDTREVTLQRDGEGVTQDDQCRAASGSWLSAYDGAILDAASKVDIDHVVPLKEAWRSEWTTQQRRAFANDLTHSQLIAVSARSNRTKGDKDPANWKPDLDSYHCTYARAWISVKYQYSLTLNQEEHDALVGMLNTCG
ncbi:HNH endonuclease family protein [Streptomyces sparsogenes]|uniref:HNH endonuclease family protein n=1 Tax=Streptomyces sparsogenes TaxID=67365 RepID=UPI0033E96C24